jgi:hypothetical protein
VAQHFDLGSHSFSKVRTRAAGARRESMRGAAVVRAAVAPATHADVNPRAKHTLPPLAPHMWLANHIVYTHTVCVTHTRAHTRAHSSRPRPSASLASSGARWTAASRAARGEAAPAAATRRAPAAAAAAAAAAVTAATLVTAAATVTTALMMTALGGAAGATHGAAGAGTGAARLCAKAESRCVCPLAPHAWHAHVCCEPRSFCSPNCCVWRGQGGFDGCACVGGRVAWP